VKNDLAWADLDILALQQRAFLLVKKPRQDFVISMETSGRPHTTVYLMQVKT
jgi:hypothetical protein